jgi:flagellar M-ring protein FliF
MALLTQLKDLWNRLPVSGRIATAGSAAATLGLIGALIYYGSQPDYGVLFADLKPADAQSIVEKLQTANVPYSLTNGGTTIQVPHDRISELRLQMAGEGALSGGHVGFDLFDKTSFGATDFAQQVNYRRAIEGELAKTLEGMDEVESARVHITPKKESVFSDKEEGAKASIMLKVRQNKELSGERSEAIVSLVASSIEGLDPSHISVMDTRGRLLVAAGDARNDASNGAGAFHAQLEAKQRYEAENAARIITLLEPVVGENKVRADVSADLDFSHVEQSEEKYNPQSQVVRSQQTATEARNTSTAQTGGIAGARSNNPATQAPPVQPAPQSTGDQRNTSTVNYEIDKTVTKTVGGGGRVNRMTVSVVVDHKSVNDVEVARSGEELKQIQDLVAAAVGINAERGDSVVVQTMPFNKLPTAEDKAAPFLERNKQLVSNASKYGALIIVAILLLLFAVRPALKAVKIAARTPDGQNLLGDGSESDERRNLSLQAGEGQAHGGFSEAQGMMTVGELQAQMGVGADPKTARKVERVETIRKQLVEQTLNDTDMVVSTMRGWLADKA